MVWSESLMSWDAKRLQSNRNPRMYSKFTVWDQQEYLQTLAYPNHKK